MSRSKDKLPVLESVRAVVSRANRVSFHPGRAEEVIEKWGASLGALPGWEHPCHFYDGGEETVRWIFTLEVLNHCFWPDKGAPVWTVKFEGGRWSGYHGLAAALKRALVRGFPVTDPAYLARIPAEDLETIFSGQGRIPLFAERLSNLREAGRVLLEKHGGDAVRLVAEAQGCAVRLVKEVVSSFPSFRDEALYGGQRVFFWKRAQIFASDLCSAFGGAGWGRFQDIDRLTAFADYKLPQVLRELGVISYDEELTRLVDGMEQLAPGSEEEVEIRAMTVWAVETLREAFGRLGRPVTSARVDNWLWDLGQMDQFRKRPYHRCRTIFY